MTTNGQRAVAALAAINTHAQAETIGSGDDTERKSHLAQDRLTRLLCALRHHADGISGLRFDEVLITARERYERQRVSHISPARVTAAAQAIEAHEQHSLQSNEGVMRSPDTFADLRYSTSARGVTVVTATPLFSALISDLHHYAADHHVDFTAALAASDHAYIEQRLQEEGPFQAGRDTRQDATIALSPAAPPFRPVATHQGVVTSMSDAEWLLVRTAARLHEMERRGLTKPALRQDTADKQALSETLAAVCGLTGPEILDQLTPQILTRAGEIENGAAAAAKMGHQHGSARAEPFSRLDMDGHDSPLMEAFGETERTTDANAMHRLALIQAYTIAYIHARKHAISAAARLAECGFPQEPGESSRRDAPSRSAISAKAAPRTGPQGPRKRS